MKRAIVFSLLTALMLTVSAQSSEEPFWLGADISGTTGMEAYGIQLMNAQGEPRENTALMKELGLNAVRLRVWVNPMRGFSSKDDVLVMAKRAKALDMPLMIDFHYSDWWADPGKQNIPEAWKDCDYEQMKAALAQHTRETLQLLKNSDIDVKWVQVGNETTNGFLWPMGNAHENMAQYAGLTKDEDETLTKAIANINQLWKKYQTPLMIVETGYDADRPEDGKRFMSRLIDAARLQTGGHCQGVFYWAPELEGHYRLGAFRNHRPTVIMDAFKEASSNK